MKASRHFDQVISAETIKEILQIASQDSCPRHKMALSKNARQRLAQYIWSIESSARLLALPNQKDHNTKGQ